MKNYKLIQTFSRTVPQSKEYRELKESLKGSYDIVFLDMAECMFGKTESEQEKIIEAFGGISALQYDYINSLFHIYFK